MTAPERLTERGWNAQLLYFTGTSQLDDRRLVVIGDRDRPARGPYDPEAAVNVFVVDLETGAAEPISANREGVRRSYVYFGGHPERGMAPGSVAAGRRGGIFYLQDRTIWSANPDDRSRRPLAEIPRGFVTGYAGLSSDATRLCLPAISEAAFADLHAIDRTVRELGLASHLWIFDTATGALVDDIVVPGGWVTHVQFHPGDADVLLFNHEWAEDGGERRMWTHDRHGSIAIRSATGDRAGVTHRDDDVEHEIWSRDGQSVIYHGTYGPSAGSLASRSFVGRLAYDTQVIDEVPFPPRFSRYGHIGVGPDGALVTDGFADYEATRPRPPAGARCDGADAPGEDDGGSWISQLDVDWERGAIEWLPIGAHDSTWSSQDAHPHPVFDDAGTSILYTSDVDGFRAVYQIPSARVGQAYGDG